MPTARRTDAPTHRRTDGPVLRCVRASVPLCLGALLAAPLSAQTINVVATRALRPTAVQLPHVRYVVAADSVSGRAILRDLSLLPVTFTGAVYVEGVAPAQRAPEPPPFADTVRFGADGRVQLLLADQRGRPPITVEVIGSRRVSGGRLAISAPGWPLDRALLVSLRPADLHDAREQGAGFGSRDRVRVDDRAGAAYLNDPSVAGTVVAVIIGLGRGRIQSDVADVIVERDFAGQRGQERRQVTALTFAIDPDRNDQDQMRAELAFGVGASEAEALSAAQAALDENATPRRAELRTETASRDVDLLVQHLLVAAGPALDWDVVAGARAIPASAREPVVRAGDAARAAVVALQRGDTAAVCGSYRLLRRMVAPDGSPRAVTLRLTTQGRTVAVDSAAAAPRDETGMIRLAFLCYLGGRDLGWLRAERAALMGHAARAADAPRAEPDAPPALELLAELEDDLARQGSGPSRGDSLRATAARLAAALPPAPPVDAWRTVAGTGDFGVNRHFGRLGEPDGLGGLSLREAGGFLSMLGREVFGVEEHVDRIEVRPRLFGAADERTWRLLGWKLSRDTLDLSLSPAIRRAELRLGALTARRLVVQLPWLNAGACVKVRRGQVEERPTPVPMADGAFLVDLRAAYEPALVEIMGQC